MHADLLATLNCRWLFSALLCAALLLGSRPACGEVLQLYAADDTRSSAVVLRHISVSKLRGIMRRVGWMSRVTHCVNTAGVRSM